MKNSQPDHRKSAGARKNRVRKVRMRLGEAYYPWVSLKRMNDYQRMLKNRGRPKFDVDTCGLMGRIYTFRFIPSREIPKDVSELKFSK